MSDPFPPSAPPPGRDVPEDAPGWAAPVSPTPSPRPPDPASPPPSGPLPPPPPGTSAGFGGAPPPPAPFPTTRGASGSRRRKASGLSVFAGLVIVVSRFFLAFSHDPSHSSSFPGIPERDQGPPVAAVSLTSDEVCGLVPLAALERVYGTPFDEGVPLPPPATGEPSDVDVAGCTWRSAPGGGGIVVNAVTVPAFGDANATYELLRPDSPVEAFDDTSGIGDEAFFMVRAPTGATGYRDSMTLRQGGVVLTLDVTADTEPAGGLDSLGEVGRVAANHAAAQDR